MACSWVVKGGSVNTVCSSMWRARDSDNRARGELTACCVSRLVGQITCQWRETTVWPSYSAQQEASAAPVGSATQRIHGKHPEAVGHNRVELSRGDVFAAGEPVAFDAFHAAAQGLERVRRFSGHPPSPARVVGSVGASERHTGVTRKALQVLRLEDIGVKSTRAPAGIGSRLIARRSGPPCWRVKGSVNSIGNSMWRDRDGDNRAGGRPTAFGASRLIGELTCRRGGASVPGSFFTWLSPRRRQARRTNEVIGASMLPGSNVFDMETEGGSLLREAAVLAAVSRPMADQLAGGAVHLSRLGGSEKGVGLGLQDAEQRVGADHGFEFRRFGRGQLTFGALARKFVIAGLGFRVRLHGDQRACQLARKTLRKRSEEPLECCGLTVGHAPTIRAAAAERKPASRRRRFISLGRLANLKGSIPHNHTYAVVRYRRFHGEENAKTVTAGARRADAVR